jgi:pyrroloquinoline-quinone synthase
MADAPRAPRVTAYANDALARIGLAGNPYFAALTDGSMSLAGFRESQKHFFYAVTFFPRPMAALVGRIPEPKARLDILHNLVEEHGEFEESQFHHNTFQRFLASIGADPGPLTTAPVPTPLRAFNSVLTSSCVLDELEVGVGCMGIIEHAFASISATIGRMVVEREWIAADDLVHYKLHAAIDERHAEEFFAVVEPKWDAPGRRYFIVQGLELGAYIFDRLYRDLHEVAMKQQA